jgi:hypothetical protein
MPCVVCSVHMETRSMGFLVEPQNQGRCVSQFGPQNRQLQFGDLTHKIIVTVSWFGLQNQVGDGLSVAPENRWVEDGAGHASRSTDLLHLKASRARVPSLPQNWWRSDDGWCTWHHHRDCVKMNLKTDGSMRRATSDFSTPTLPFL